MAFAFEDFIMMVPEEQQPYISSLHNTLLAGGSTLVVKEAKRGFVVSYKWENKTILNWVFRKKGMLARIYGDHASQYEPLIAELPAHMQESMKKARDCKRLLDSTLCSSRCVKGMVYQLDGEVHKKCRNGGMNFYLSDDTGPHIKALTLAELNTRIPA